MSEEKLKRIVIVDDSASYCDLWSNFIGERYADIARVETYSHPYDALPKIDDSIDLLIVDLEMPGMDGKKFVEYARAKGLSAAPHRGHVLPLRRRAPPALPHRRDHRRHQQDRGQAAGSVSDDSGLDHAAD